MIQSEGQSRAQLRRLLRIQRRALSKTQQHLASKRLYQQLAMHPVFRRARRVAFYLPNDGEIDPRLLLRAAFARGKAVFLPVLRPWPRHQMVLQRLYPNETLTMNRFKIREPRFNRSRQVAVWSLDVLFMPLVGFDTRGGRLGMGGGFYDRSLAFLNRRSHRAQHPLLLGLAHECQKVDRLPLAPWDVPVHAVVTDANWYGPQAL